MPDRHNPYFQCGQIKELRLVIRKLLVTMKDELAIDARDLLARIIHARSSALARPAEHPDGSREATRILGRQEALEQLDDMVRPSAE